MRMPVASWPRAIGTPRAKQSRAGRLHQRSSWQHSARSSQCCQCGGNAHQDRVPMIVLTGRVDQHEAESYTHQVFDHQAFFRPITKASFSASSGAVARMIDRAVNTAIEGQPVGSCRCADWCGRGCRTSGAFFEASTGPHNRDRRGHWMRRARFSQNQQSRSLSPVSMRSISRQARLSAPLPNVSRPLF